MPVVLTLAGSDSGGGAGIQADLKTFEAHGVFGTCVITTLTAQNTSRVEQVWAVPEEMIVAQFRAVTSDMPVKAAKTGMLFSEAIIRTVARELRTVSFPLVVDPVMVATSGDLLLQPAAIETLCEEILPLATVLTPNLPEAEMLSGRSIRTHEEMEVAARQIGARYPQAWVLIKGGHLQHEADAFPDEMNDLLHHGGNSTWLRGQRIQTPHTHGTGCTLSAAITANIALGFSVTEATVNAKKYLTRALSMAWDDTGKGRGSLRHNLNLLPIS